VREILSDCGIEPAPEVVADLCVYLRELDDWNRKTNLTGLRSVRDMALKHIGDTLVLAEILPAVGRTLLDIGTGAGAPGLVLKLLRPELDVVLVDAARKKISFLHSVIALTGARGVWAEHGRARRNWRPAHFPAPGFDIVVSQAVGTLSGFAKLAEPMLASGGVAIAMKGPRGEEELKTQKLILAGQGWQVAVVRARLPVLGHARLLVCLRRGEGDREV